MNRRKFLSSASLILGAPAIVRAESLMKIWVPPESVWIGCDPGIVGRSIVRQLLPHQDELNKRISEALRKAMATHEPFMVPPPHVDLRNHTLWVGSPNTIRPENASE